MKDTASDEAKDAPTKGKRGASVALLGGSLLFAMSLAEIGMRIVGYGQVMEYVPSASWGYLMRPSQDVYTYGHPVRINALGLRGPEVASPKAAGSKRVVFVGDSITYGGGKIPEASLFTRVFESSARAEGLAVEAVSIAAPGWSPRNWRGYIEQNGLHDADLVVLMLPECDLARPYTTMDMHGFKEDAPSLRTVATLMKIKDIASPAPFGAFDPDETAPLNLEAVRYLEERAGKERFVPVFIPSVPEIPIHHRFWPRYEEALPGALDLRKPLDDKSHFMDGVHLTGSGHAIVGKALLERLRPMLK